MKAFDKKPSKGGIPEIEKKINTKEKDQILLETNKFDKEDKNKEIEFVLKKLFKFFCDPCIIVKFPQTNIEVNIYVIKKKIINT
jgi:hypothetical protein